MLCLIDPGSDAVREAAFACVDTYMSKLREVSARMKIEEAERRRIEVRAGIVVCEMRGWRWRWAKVVAAWANK